MKFLIPIAVFVALVAVFSFGLQSGRDPSHVPSPLIGKPAPEFTLPTLADPGLMVGTQDLRGKVSLLNVWATWCVGCRQEHDTLLQIASTHGIPIYGLNWKDNPPDKPRTWLQQLGNPYVVNAVDALGDVAIDWGVYGAPETFLMDADGIVLHKHVGPLTPGIWETDFLPIIAAASGREL